MNNTNDFSQIFSDLANAFGDVATPPSTRLENSDSAALPLDPDINNFLEELLYEDITPIPPVVEEGEVLSVETTINSNTDPVHFAPLATDAPEPAKMEVFGLEDNPDLDRLLTDYDTHLNTNITAEVTSSELIINPVQLRYSAADWFDKAQHYSMHSGITLIGAGGIGSWTAIILAKMSFKLIMYDHDRVDVSNMAGQFFRYEDLNTYKVNAINDICYKVNPIRSHICYTNQFIATCRASLITIVAVDNMAARKIAFCTWVDDWGNNPNALFIDGRLAAETYQIYTITGGDIAAQVAYASSWFSDSQGDTESCSYKQTSYMAAGIGHRIAMHVANFFANLTLEVGVPRSLPYYIELTPYAQSEEVFAPPLVRTDISQDTKVRSTQLHSLM